MEEEVEALAALVGAKGIWEDPEEGGDEVEKPVGGGARRMDGTLLLKFRVRGLFIGRVSLGAT